MSLYSLLTVAGSLSLAFGNSYGEDRSHWPSHKTDEPSYKDWPTPKPSEYNHHKWPSMKMETPHPTKPQKTPRPTWEKTPKPTKEPKTPHPTKEKKTPRPTWAKTPKPTKEPKTPRPTWAKTPKPTKEDKTPHPTKRMDWPSKKPTEDYAEWPTKWSSDKSKYSMRYADAAHDYKGWKTEKPTKYEPKWNTPKPTKWSGEEPHYQPRYGDNHWAKKTPKPSKKYNHWERTPRPTEHKQWNTPKPSKYGQWERENDYEEEVKRAAHASYGYVPPPGYERRYD